MGEGRESWTLSALLAAGAWRGFYAIFDRLLHIPFPAGWLIP